MLANVNVASSVFGPSFVFLVKPTRVRQQLLCYVSLQYRNNHALSLLSDPSVFNALDLSGARNSVVILSYCHRFK